MKTYYRFALCVTAMMVSGCAQTGYFADRRHDLADVVTVCGGLGLGLRAQTGPVTIAPVIMTMDLVGLRGGELFSIPELGAETDTPPIDAGALWWCTSIFDLESDGRPQQRGKSVFSLPVPQTEKDMQFTVFSESWPFIAVPRMVWQAEEKQLERYPLHYWSQLEVTLGILGSLRLGANPGELVDFILGWLTVDLYGDDLARRPVLSRAASAVTVENGKLPAPGVRETN